MIEQMPIPVQLRDVRPRRILIGMADEVAEMATVAIAASSARRVMRAIRERKLRGAIEEEIALDVMIFSVRFAVKRNC